VSGDGDGVDVWLGSVDDIFVQAIIFTVDLLKDELEPKIVIGWHRRRDRDDHELSWNI
jgi:hypothetical protein